MVTLNCGTLFNLMTNVATKFLTGSSTMIYIFLMMALLLKLVESLVMTAPPRHLPLWEQLVSENILETSRAYSQL